MSVSITIRNVPDEVRDELATRAALAGQSLQEYLSQQLRELTDRPQIEHVLADIRRNAAAFPFVSNDEILEAIHADRS